MVCGLVIEVFHCFCYVFTPILDYNCRSFALFITSVRLLMSWFRACRSFLVRLSDSFCLCLCSFMISILTLCRKVSNVPLSVNLSGLKGCAFLILNGSISGSLWFVVEFKFAFHPTHKQTALGHEVGGC